MILLIRPAGNQSVFDDLANLHATLSSFGGEGRGEEENGLSTLVVVGDHASFFVSSILANAVRHRNPNAMRLICEESWRENFGKKSVQKSPKGSTTERMQVTLSQNSMRLVKWLSVLLVVKIVLFVLYGYRDYFPPNFEVPFLLGRQKYFFGHYSWSFYAHLASGPTTLILGLILLSNRFRLRYANWHRLLGRIQVGMILLVLVPSGIGMSFYALTGMVAVGGFLTTALLTAICVLLGWRAAVRKDFVTHQLWMLRCFGLLCSAVVIRIIGGLGTVYGWDAPWIYQASAWISWLLPLAAIEIHRNIQWVESHSES